MSEELFKWPKKCIKCASTENLKPHGYNYQRVYTIPPFPVDIWVCDACVDEVEAEKKKELKKNFLILIVCIIIQIAILIIDPIFPSIPYIVDTYLIIQFILLMVTVFLFPIVIPFFTLVVIMKYSNRKLKGKDYHRIVYKNRGFHIYFKNDDMIEDFNQLNSDIEFELYHY